MRGFNSRLGRTLRYNIQHNDAPHINQSKLSCLMACQRCMAWKLRKAINNYYNRYWKKGERDRMRGWGRLVCDEAELPFLGVTTYLM